MQPLPHGAPQQWDHAQGGDGGANRCADVDPDDQPQVAEGNLGAAECSAERLGDDECAAEGDADDDGGCCIGAGEKETFANPRQFENPLLRDYEPRQQRLEMVIPPHAHPWVVQRIMGGGDPRGALVSIASFIEEAFLPDHQAEHEAQCTPDFVDKMHQSAEHCTGEHVHGDAPQPEALREQSNSECRT